MSFFTDVKDFQIAFGQRVGQRPEFPIDKERELRRNLLKEEYLEYLNAELEDNFVEVADALADIIYIACGTAVSYGIPLDKIFEEVHNSNMSKLVDGKPMYREDGKVMKPEGWKPPNIRKILDTSRDYNA
jgi:predicted HAD superfamily Cof-like phosphohydrolase